MSTSCVPPIGRGGPQVIPRPSAFRLGGPSPWADLVDRSLTLDHLVTVFDGRESGGIQGRRRGDESPAAVLIALYDDPAGGGPHVVLTRRSPLLTSHSHEVAFPGGRQDPNDLDLWATALREAEEEVRINPAAVHLLGRLDPLVTVGSRSIIHPYVAVLNEPPALVPNLGEVEAILYVSLAELLLDEAYREEEWSNDDASLIITFFELVGDTVWGATAAMLRQLLAVALKVDNERRYRVDP
ncbi:MAG: CoA pyrophosphatase [Acidimicrobiales bacterium]|nr:CoA pyrophosphatase [Acidimicrobiales bacterium]